MSRVEVHATIHRPAEEILEAIFDAANWTSFTGHGIIPGIASVRITAGPNGRLGTRFDVTNTDGSTHVETVTSYGDGHLSMRMDRFSRPLSLFADHFIETWEIQGNVLTRRLDLVARNMYGRAMLRLIRGSLRRAVENQTAAMCSK